MPRDLLATLFDVRFESLITTRIIRLLYCLSMLAVALVAIVLVIVGFSIDATVGAVTLVIVAPLYVLGSLVYARVLLEFVIALLRIMENTQEIVRLGRERAAQAGAVAEPVSS